MLRVAPSHGGLEPGRFTGRTVMLAIDVHYDTPAKLRERLVPGSPDGGLFVDGHYAAETGLTVLVRVSSLGLPGDLVFESTVGFVREDRDSSPSRPGIGVFVVPEHRNRFAYLRAWAEGRAWSLERLDGRLPAAQCACMLTLGTTTPRRVPSRLIDVSDHGACVEVAQPVARAMGLTLELKPLDDLEDFAADVMWSHEGHAGLKLRFDTVTEREKWPRIVSAFRHAFLRRLLTPVPAGNVRPGAEPQEGTTRYSIVDRDALKRRSTRSPPSMDLPVVQLPANPIARLHAATQSYDPREEPVAIAAMMRHPTR